MFTMVLVVLHVALQPREYFQRREATFPAFLLQRFGTALRAVKPQGRKHTV
jgi:hypothetical protein